MTLPTYSDLATYLRLDPSDIAAEQALLIALMVRGQAILETALTFPLLSTPFTYVDRSESGIQDRSPRLLMFPVRPIDTNAANTTVVDRNGLTVDPTTYTVSPQQGFIRANFGINFPNGPYTLSTNIGLQFMWNYALTLETLVGQAIIDLAADLYQRRTPAAHQEAAGDTRITWDVARDTLARALLPIKALKLPVGAV